MQVETRGEQTCPVLSSTMTPSMAMKRSGAGPGKPKHGFISHIAAALALLRTWLTYTVMCKALCLVAAWSLQSFETPM
jgi:hypothetical protein